MALLLVIIAPLCSTAQKMVKKQPSRVPDSHFSIGKGIQAGDGATNGSTGKTIPKIVEEKGLFFEVYTMIGDNPANDSGIITKLIFHIEEPTDRFALQGSALRTAAKAFIERQCRCMDNGFQQVFSGQIKGFQNDDGSWTLDIDIMAKGYTTKKEYPFRYSGLITKK